MNPNSETTEQNIKKIPIKVHMLEPEIGQFISKGVVEKTPRSKVKTEQPKHKFYYVAVAESYGKTFKENDLLCLKVEKRHHITKAPLASFHVLSSIDHKLDKKVTIANKVYDVYEAKRDAFYTTQKIPHPENPKRFTYALATSVKPKIGDTLVVRSIKNKALDAFVVAKVTPLVDDPNRPKDPNHKPLFLVERSTERFEELDNNFPYKNTIQKFLAYLKKRAEKFADSVKEKFQKPFTRDSRPFNQRDRYNKTGRDFGTKQGYTERTSSGSSESKPYKKYNA